MEIWKNIEGYEQYQVSNFGNVKTVANEATRKERLLKPLAHYKGYKRVGLCLNNKAKFYFIHRLVATYFLENNDNKETINHKDGNKENNHYLNLEWATYRENMNHAIDNKLSSCGERNGRAKLTYEQVEEIKQSLLSQRKLAVIYEVCQTTIGKIKQGKGWK